MIFDPEHERRRAPGGPAFGDAVTFAWADAARGWFGMVRIGLAAQGGSVLSVLMRGREPVGVTAVGGLEVAADADWESLEAGGVRTAVTAPLERWTVALDEEGHGFDLVFEAVAAPGGANPMAGTEGYEQLCRVTGTVRAAGATVAVDGLGQRGHVWGEPDWSGVELTRTVSAWLGTDLGGVALATARPSDATGHADEHVRAVLVEHGEPVDVADPRLSTTYDGDGHVRRAGMELWVQEDGGYPLRAAGEVLCGTTLDLGALSLDIAFMAWHAEGHQGVGRYEILRRLG